MVEEKEKCYSFKEVTEIPKQRQKASLYKNILEEFNASTLKMVRLDWKGEATMQTLQTSLRAALRGDSLLKNSIGISVQSHKEGEKRIIDNIYLKKVEVPKKKSK